MSEYECERACQYAMEVGLPEYSGLDNGTCGNCAHYAPIERECAICYPLGIECEWCEGAKEATHRVIVGVMTDHWGQKREQVSPMCHGCAVEQRQEKDWGHAS